MSNNYLPIAGTWSRDDNPNDLLWWEPKSPFNLFAETNKYKQILVDDDPFIWSANVDGIDFHHHNWDWMTAGSNLAHYLKAVPLEDRNLLAHSHGGQVALYAASHLPINSLLTISTPVRQDMQNTITAARPNIKRWVHVHSDYTDTWQAYGELFDGHFGIVRNMSRADKNIMIPGVGHSDILYQPTAFHHWNDHSLFGYLT